MNTYNQLLKAITSQYFDFRGRTGRKVFWLYIIVILLSFFLVVQAHEFAAKIFVLTFAVPTLAIMTRRFHDIGKSGWLTTLLFFPYPLYLAIVAPVDMYFGAEGSSLLATFVALGVVLLYPVLGLVFVYWFLKPSQTNASSGTSTAARVQ